MKNFWKRNWKNALCIVCMISVVASFSAGCAVGKKTTLEKAKKKVSKMEKLIDTYYLNDVDEDAMEQSIYKGLMSGLDDPYSVYYTSEEFTKLMEDTQGTYVGIGVSVRQDTENGYIKVVKAFTNGPAYAAGVKDGDFITEVNGEDIKDQNLETIVGKIKGEEGTTVDVTFYRSSDDKYYTFTIERKSVDIPTIEHKMLKNDIGYIQIAEFDDVTVQQYLDALQELEDKGEKGLIIDLRDNPGGVLDGVVTMLQNMLPKGTILYTEDKNGKGDTYTSDGTHEFKKPLVLLVNGNSASAAEVFTGAIKDYDMGTIVGTTTFGKGIVQRLFDLNDGSAIKLTVSKYYTPSGVCIHGKGIEPDVEIEYDASLQTGEEYDMEKDNQLQKAIEVMEEKIK